MPAATRTITINRPIEDVFAFLADGARVTPWRPGVLDISHVFGQGVGATWRQGVKGPGGRRIAADYRITASEPPTHLTFDAIAGPVRPHGDYRLESVDGGTRLTFWLEAQLGMLKGLLMGGAVQRTMDAEMQATDTLKRVLETP